MKARSFLLSYAAPRATGLADLPGFPMTDLAQLVSPFRWRQIQRAGSLKRAA